MDSLLMLFNTHLLLLLQPSVLWLSVVTSVNNDAKPPPKWFLHEFDVSRIRPRLGGLTYLETFTLKEITILFSTHWQKLWKSGEEDWQTVGYEQEFIENKSKSKNTGKASAWLQKSGFLFGIVRALPDFFKNDRRMLGRDLYQCCLFISCTEDHTCTVVNNVTCVLSARTVNWRQRSFIRVFFVSASVWSMDRCYKLFLP